MTVLQYTEYVLDNNWKATYPGRTDVPKPTFYLEATSAKRHNLKDGDMVTILDGGPVNYEPQSVGWAEERMEVTIQIDIRSIQSRERMFGDRDANNVAEPYGGLVGEIKRIFDTKRKGDQEFDIIKLGTMNDMTDQTGYSVFRVVCDLTFVTVAQNVNP